MNEVNDFNDSFEQEMNDPEFLEIQRKQQQFEDERTEKELEIKEADLISSFKIKAFPILKVSNEQQLKRINIEARKEQLLNMEKIKFIESHKEEYDETYLNEFYARQIKKNAPKAKSNLVVKQIDDSVGPPDRKDTWICEELGLSLGAPLGFIGDMCSGKTMFAAYLASCIATGAPIFNQFAVSKGDIVHVDLDNQGETMTRERYYRIFANLGEGQKKYEYVYSTKKLDELGVDENGESMYDSLKELMTNKKLIIIDCFRAAISVDENDSKARDVIDLFSRLTAETKCFAIFLLHTGRTKSKDNRNKHRGSSSIAQALGKVWEFENELGSKLYKIIDRKPRDGELTPPFTFTIEDLGERLITNKNKKEKLNFKFLGFESETSEGKKLPEKSKEHRALDAFPSSKDKLIKMSDIQKKATGFGNDSWALLREQFKKDELIIEFSPKGSTKVCGVLTEKGIEKLALLDREYAELIK